MTKEERAEKWFRNIPNAETISMEKKMKICSKAARRSMIIFTVLFSAECILLFMASGAAVFNRMADFLNSLMTGNHSGNHHKGAALIGSLLCLPLIVLPLIAAVAFKNIWIQSEALSVQQSEKSIEI